MRRAPMMRIGTGLSVSVIACACGLRTPVQGLPDPAAEHAGVDAAVAVDSAMVPDSGSAPLGLDDVVDTGIGPAPDASGPITSTRTCPSPAGCNTTALCRSSNCNLLCLATGAHCDSGICEITGGDGCGASCNEAACLISLGDRATAFCYESEGNERCVVRCGAECEARCDGESWCQVDAGDRSRLICDAQDYPCAFTCGAGCEVLLFPDPGFNVARPAPAATAAVGSNSTVRCPGCDVHCAGRCRVSCSSRGACECTGDGCQVTRRP